MSVIARRATTLLLVVAQVGTAAYLVVYLARWQWNRALICGVLLLATELLLVGRLILHRLRAIEARLDGLAAERVRVHLVQHRPEPADRFAWLRDATTRTNVFLPVLLGAGVLASAAAWAVENVARRTARPAMERQLAGALAPLAFPDGGFLPAPGDPDPWAGAGWSAPAPGAARTAGDRRRRLAVIAAAVVVTAGLGLGIDVVADATQTRPEQLDDDVMTIVDLRFRGDRALADLERHARNLVQLCTSEPFRREVETEGLAAIDASTVRVVLDGDLGRYGTARLRGCFEDVTLEQIQASVASITEVRPAGDD